MSKDDPSSGVSRRRVIQTVGSASTSFSLATSAGTVVGATDGPTVTIPVVMVDGEPKTTKEVPKAWWNFESRASKVRNKVSRRYRQHKNVVGFALGRSNKRVSGRRVSTVDILVKPGTEGSLDVPDQVDEVKIEIKPDPQFTPTDCYDQTYDCVPGGAHISSDNGSATAGCKVTYSNDSYLLTAAHTFTDKCSRIGGEPAYQPNSRKIGEVDVYNHQKDYALVGQTSDSKGSGFTDEVVDHNWTQSGYVSQEACKDFKSTGEQITHFGKTTCEKTTTINQCEASFGYCNDTDNPWAVTFDYEVESGDSGGPFVHKYTFNNKIYFSVLAITHGSGSGYSNGVAAHEMTNENIGFDPDHC